MKKIDSEKIKMLTNRKIVLGVSALLMLMIVVFLFSFIPYTISPERLRELSFITDLLMLCVITILAMISTVFIGQASNAQNALSKIAKATVRFIASKLDVERKGILNFKQWVEKVLQPKDTETVKKRILDSYGIEDYSILKLSITEIRQLTEAQKFNGEFYAPLTEEQIEAVIKVKTKGIHLNFVPADYYLSVKSITDKRTKSERAADEGKKKAMTLLVSVGSKLALTISFSIIIALFVRDLTVGDYTALEVATKLFSRLLAFFTSVFMGYLVGCQINDIDAEYIDMRIETHKEFLEDEEFVGKTAKEMAKEAFIDRVKEEQVLQLDNKSNQIELHSEEVQETQEE